MLGEGDRKVTGRPRRIRGHYGRNNRYFSEMLL
jgi:hypothetical protein